MNNKKYFIVIMILAIFSTQIKAAEYNSRKYEEKIQKIVNQGDNEIKTIGANVQLHITPASSEEEKQRIARAAFSQSLQTAQGRLEEILRTLQESDNEQRRCQQNKK